MVTIPDYEESSYDNSQELDDLGQALYNAFVPAQWIPLMPQTQKPIGSWVDHYCRRYQQYDKWAKEGEPIVFWLSGLHIPESLLSALVQASSRRRGWALDKSTLYTEMSSYTSMEQVDKYDKIRIEIRTGKS